MSESGSLQNHGGHWRQLIQQMLYHILSLHLQITDTWWTVHWKKHLPCMPLNDLHIDHQ